MANQINTRIQLKYDSYAKWDAVKDTFIPLKGELCIAELAATATADQSNASIQHPILFKVGDGTHFWKDLPWASALAADVYSWAKLTWDEFKAQVLPVIQDAIAAGAELDESVSGNVKTINHEVKLTGGFTGTSVGDSLTETGKTLTITVPKLTVNQYGHVTAASDVTYTINIPTPEEVALPSMEATDTLSDVDVSGDSVEVIGGVTASLNNAGDKYEIQYQTATVPTKNYVDGAIEDAVDAIDHTRIYNNEGGAVNSEVKTTTTGVSVSSDAGGLEVDVKDTIVLKAAREVASSNPTTTVTIDGNGLTVNDELVATEERAREIAQGVDTNTEYEFTGDDYITVTDEYGSGADIHYYSLAMNEDALKAIIGEQTTAAMEFKGATATLPATAAKGDMYKVSGSFEVAGETAKVGDSIVYDGTQWYLIPSGDDIEDTWRPVKAGGNTLETDETLEFVAGVNVAIAEEGGKVTISATDTTYTAGAKLDLNGTEFSHETVAAPTASAGTGRTYLTGVTTDGYGHITGYTTASESDQDLSGYKTKQAAVVDPTENGTSETFIATIAQNENGEIVATKKAVPQGTGTATIATVTGGVVTLKGAATLSGHALENSGTDITLAKVATSGAAADISGLAEIATTGSIYDVAEGANVSTGTDAGAEYLIFNCGTASTVI